MTQESEGPSEGGITWQDIPEEQWERCLQTKAIVFVENGYSVEWYSDGNN